MTGLMWGLGMASSLLLLVAATRGWRPAVGVSAERSLRATRWRRPDGRRLWLALAAAASVAVISRWPVAALGAFALVVLWPRFFGAASEAGANLALLEGLTTWTESLRDMVAGSIGLEQAIPASVRAAPPPLAPAVHRLVGMLQTRLLLPEALIRFAGELDDPSADLVVAALVLNSRLRGPGLVQTLTALATTAREEVELRRRVEENRRQLRRAASIIVVVTLGFAGALTVFSRAYVEPYSSFPGQAALVAVIGIFATGFAWMRKVASARPSQRLLANQPFDRLQAQRLNGRSEGGRS